MQILNAIKTKSEMPAACDDFLRNKKAKSNLICENLLSEVMRRIKIKTFFTSRAHK